jgi:hypothetical protein
MLKRIALVVGVLAFAGAAFATTLNGSLPMHDNAGGVLSQDGANLSVSTTITASWGLTTSTVSDTSNDYHVVPGGTFFTDNGTIETPVVLNLADLAAFTFTNPDYGTWHTAGTGSYIVSRSASFLNVYLVGTFTPAASGPLSGYEATNSSLRISINQSGTSLSAAITLNSPAEEPPRVPEPVTTLLLGSGLLALGLVRRRLSA